MIDIQALTNHVNDQIRCETHDPQPEGINRDKMKLITSKRGASWENIYEILFPGAPIPSPCMIETCSAFRNEELANNK